MFLDKDYFESWMRRIEERLERIEKNTVPKPEEPVLRLEDGSRLLDNYDVCQMLHISKRTLQRYRSLGELPYQMIYNKTYYREADVVKFLENHFSSFRNLRKAKKK